MSQCTQILVHMKHHGSITPLEALKRYNCLRLAARIDNLRNRGHNIETDIIKRKGKRYAKYRLVING